MEPDAWRAQPGKAESIVALRPVAVYSEDYAPREYGATPEEMDAALAKAEREWKRDAQRGKVKPFKL